MRNPLPPSLDGIDTWVFDLDNTLYPPLDSVFVEVGRRIREYTARFLGVDEETARQVQRAYFLEYGTTLRGLMVRHGLDPLPYLAYVHDIDLAGIAPDPALDAVLARLPGRKIVFTNADAPHVERVLERVGIARHFDGVFDIHAADFVPKPEPGPYAGLVRRHGLDCARAAMFEDTARNLEPAARLGMTTVWVRNGTAWAAEGADADYVHFVADPLVTWLEQSCPLRPVAAAGAGRQNFGSRPSQAGS